MSKTIQIIGGIPTEVVIPVSANGDWQQLFHTVTAGEISAKQIIMDPIPLVPSEVGVDLIGGGSQEYGIDFNIVSSSILTWSGLGLLAILEEGNILKLCYFS